MVLAIAGWVMSSPALAARLAGARRVAGFATVVADGVVTVTACLARMVFAASEADGPVVAVAVCVVIMSWPMVFALGLRSLGLAVVAIFGVSVAFPSCPILLPRSWGCVGAVVTLFAAFVAGDVAPSCFVRGSTLVVLPNGCAQLCAQSVQLGLLCLEGIV